MARAFPTTYAELSAGAVIEYGIGRAQITQIDTKVPKHWPKNSAMVHLTWTRHRSVPERLKGKRVGSIAVSLDWPITVFC